MSALEEGLGYFCGLSLAADELARVREHVATSFMRRIGSIHPELEGHFTSIEMDRYHELSELVNHRQLWGIRHRILERDATTDILSMSLIRSLKSEFGPFDITDAEGAGHANMIWRIVRPEQWADVGPLHADAWFWKLGYKNMPPSARSMKVWIAIYCEPGQSGLRIVPDSHKRIWPYHGEFCDGIVKPHLDINETELDCQALDLKPGQAVIFNDLLLHGGLPSPSKTRVSLEFTIWGMERRMQ